MKKFAIGAFTLAETLITLGIIGVVASLTLPSFIQKQQDMVTVTALKKAYSILSSAYTLALQEKGDPTTWGLTTYPDYSGSKNLMNKIKPYLKVAKDCGTSSGCFPDNYNALIIDNPQDINGESVLAKLDLTDGSLLGFVTYSSTCEAYTANGMKNVCGAIYIDINGFKSPNVIGKDMFLIWVTKYKLLPVGDINEGLYKFSSDCIGLNANGWGCTAWVIYNENLDYLHCSDLSWTGKLKCS